MRFSTVDLYYVHVPPSDFDPLRRMLEGYARAKEQDRIGRIGISCRKLRNDEEIAEALR